MKTRIINFLLVFCFAGPVFLSCKKDGKDNNNTNSTTEDAQNMQAAEDNAYAEQVFADAFNIVDDAVRRKPGLYKTAEEFAVLSGCDSIMADTTSVAGKKILTIDFGSGCEGKDGKIRKGKIIASLTGRYRTPGTIITTTFDNYYVNDNKVEGIKTVTNKGRNTNGNIEFEIEVKNAKITNSAGVISWESTRKREWIAGENTLFNPLDDVYHITGSASGTDRKSRAYTLTITKPLRVQINCRNISAGTIEIEPQGLSKRILDYGNGTCDKDATLTINGKVHNISLR